MLSAHHISYADAENGAVNICFLSSMHPPLDKRIHVREAVTLVNRGFSVVHLCPGEYASAERRDGVIICRYPGRHGLIGRIKQLPLLYRLAARLDADCYHSNEVDTWVVGVLLTLTKRGYLVADIHERHPADLAQSRFPPSLRPAVMTCVRVLLRVLARYTDRLILANPSVSDDLPASSRPKQVEVLNYPPRVLAERPRSNVRAPEGPETDTVTVFAHGLMSRARGWPALLEALALSTDPRLVLHVVGTFSDGSADHFRRRASELYLRGRVIIEGWMPLGEVTERLLQADIGVVLFQPGPVYHTYALPHKLFEYMAAGLAVVASREALYVASAVTDARCGTLVDPTSPLEVARALDHLARDTDRRRILGENGREAVKTLYNWESQAENLVQVYHELLSQPNPSG